MKIQKYGEKHSLDIYKYRIKTIWCRTPISTILIIEF